MRVVGSAAVDRGISMDWGRGGSEASVERAGRAEAWVERGRLGGSSRADVSWVTRLAELAPSGGAWVTEGSVWERLIGFGGVSWCSAGRLRPGGASSFDSDGTGAGGW